MKKFFLCWFIIFIVGCHWGTEGLKHIVRDPHYMHYQEELDALESSYLQGKISYSVYLERKKKINQKYEREVKEREATIHQTTK